MIVQYTLQGRAMAIDLATIQAVTGVDGIPDLCECAIACGSITVPLTPEAMFWIWREGLALSIGRMQRLWLDLDMGRIVSGADEAVAIPAGLRVVIQIYEAIKGSPCPDDIWRPSYGLHPSTKGSPRNDPDIR